MVKQKAGKVIYQSASFKRRQPGSLEEQREKLDQLIKLAHQPIFKTTTVFPFDLTPNSMVIEIDKVNLISHEFLGSEQIRSLAVKDLGEIIVETGMFFATLKILERRVGPDNIIEIKNLKREDAMRARRILQGLVAADKQGIDLTKFDPEELAKKAEELGQTTEAE